MKNYRILFGRTSLLFVFSIFSLQAQQIIHITPEISEHVIAKNNLYDMQIFHVIKTEVEYHTADTLPKTKKEYKWAIDNLEKYKSHKDGPTHSFAYIQYQDALEDIERIKKDIAQQILSDQILKRQTFIVDPPLSITPIELSGDFIILPDEYVVALQDIDGKFVKNEVSSELRGYYNMGGVSDYYNMIQKDGTEEYYFIMSKKYLTGINSETKLNGLIDSLNKIGYKPYQDGEYMYIKTKTVKIQLNSNLYNREFIENPKNYISSIDNDYIKIDGLIKQTVTHSQTLDKYLSTYNIQRSNMPTSTINLWRTATTNAQILLNKIMKINEKYAGDYSIITLEKSTTYETFLDNVLASKGVLGM